jgi:hypothetical protein
MLAYANTARRPPLNIDVYVGLSPSLCYWHFDDPPYLLGNDLIISSDLQLQLVENWPIVVPVREPRRFPPNLIA